MTVWLWRGNCIALQRLRGDLRPRGWGRTSLSSPKRGDPGCDEGQTRGQEAATGGCAAARAGVLGLGGPTVQSRKSGGKEGVCSRIWLSAQPPGQRPRPACSKQDPGPGFTQPHRWRCGWRARHLQGSLRATAPTGAAGPHCQGSAHLVMLSQSHLQMMSPVLVLDRRDRES